jgi:hypothetical protein
MIRSLSPPVSHPKSATALNMMSSVGGGESVAVALVKLLKLGAYWGIWGGSGGRGGDMEFEDLGGVVEALGGVAEDLFWCWGGGPGGGPGFTRVALPLRLRKAWLGGGPGGGPMSLLAVEATAAAMGNGTTVGFGVGWEGGVSTTVPPATAAAAAAAVSSWNALSNLISLLKCIFFMPHDLNYYYYICTLCKWILIQQKRALILHAVSRYSSKCKNNAH